MARYVFSKGSGIPKTFCTNITFSEGNSVVGRAYEAFANQSHNKED